MADIEIRIGSEVSDAVQGLQQVQNELDKTGNALKQLPSVTNQATFTINNFARVVQDAPYGIRGVANNIDPLIESFLRLRVQTGSTGGAFRALLTSFRGPAGILLAVSTATTLMTIFSDELAELFNSSKKAETGVKDLKESINDIFTETAKEATAVNGFIAILKNETETRKRKLEALKELKDIQPDIFGGLELEGQAVKDLDVAYSDYLANQKTVIAVKIKQLQLEQLLEQQLRQQGITLVGVQKDFFDGTKRLQQLRENDPALQGGDVNRVKEFYNNIENENAKAAKALQDDIDELFKSIVELSKGIKTTPLKEVEIKPKKIKINNKEAKVEVTKPIQLPELIFNEPNTQRITELNQILNKISFFRIEKGLDLIRQYFKGTTEEAELSKIAIQDLGKLDISTEFLKDPEKKEQLLAIIKERMDEIVEIGQVVGSVLTPAFQGLFDTMEEGGDAIQAFFKGLGQGIKQLVQAFIQTAAIAGIVSLITGVPFAGTFQTLAGRALPGRRANGGPVNDGTPYIIGERGPELFIPSVSGNVVPNYSISSFMGGRNSNESGRTSVLRGQDILLAYARTQRSQLRVNG